ncbi:uncharacterized protein EV422DRAFT_206693 [Fimicolochytrium jonesii]|uniref:uncharacterized protein n=1 Tax=Fimicolochytrium jonesii TaxID=1396493 RepID=UPI0022FEEEAB|nr:uncharacterized protein EV422DRAFT_206693 [Fimicolochytrium jonesii]KAI8817810.1 hypothetical protein EV422DRAFT_206693 [Fimicolochytrium jonesii]
MKMPGMGVTDDSRLSMGHHVWERQRYHCLTILRTEGSLFMWMDSDVKAGQSCRVWMSRHLHALSTLERCAQHITGLKVSLVRLLAPYHSPLIVSFELEPQPVGNSACIHLIVRHRCVAVMIGRKSLFGKSSLTHQPFRTPTQLPSTGDRPSTPRSTDARAYGSNATANTSSRPSGSSHPPRSSTATPGNSSSSTPRLSHEDIQRYLREQHDQFEDTLANFVESLSDTIGPLVVSAVQNELRSHLASGAISSLSASSTPSAQPALPGSAADTFLTKGPKTLKQMIKNFLSGYVPGYASLTGAQITGYGAGNTDAKQLLSDLTDPMQEHPQCAKLEETLVDFLEDEPQLRSYPLDTVYSEMFSVVRNRIINLKSGRVKEEAKVSTHGEAIKRGKRSIPTDWDDLQRGSKHTPPLKPVSADSPFDVDDSDDVQDEEDGPRRQTHTPGKPIGRTPNSHAGELTPQLMACHISMQPIHIEPRSPSPLPRLPTYQLRQTSRSRTMWPVLVMMTRFSTLWQR